MVGAIAGPGSETRTDTTSSVALPVGVWPGSNEMAAHDAASAAAEASVTFVGFMRVLRAAAPFVQALATSDYGEFAEALST
jgi:hypothetical protein